MYEALTVEDFVGLLHESHQHCFALSFCKLFGERSSHCQEHVAKTVLNPSVGEPLLVKPYVFPYHQSSSHSSQSSFPAVIVDLKDLPYLGYNFLDSNLINEHCKQLLPPPSQCI